MLRGRRSGASPISKWSKKIYQRILVIQMEFTHSQATIKLSTPKVCHRTNFRPWAGKLNSPVPLQKFANSHIQPNQWAWLSSCVRTWLRFVCQGKSLGWYCKIVLKEGLPHSRFICMFFYYSWIKPYRGTFIAGKEYLYMHLHFKCTPFLLRNTFIMLANPWEIKSRQSS